MGQPLTVWRTALHQKRPYLTLKDVVRSVEFIIKNDLFDQRIYNILTENLTVNSIIQFTERHVPQLNIQYVDTDTEIMSQLSYEVSNLRFRRQGLNSQEAWKRRLLKRSNYSATSKGNYGKSKSELKLPNWMAT